MKIIVAKQIFDQLTMIRDSGLTNMFDIDNVKYLADIWECDELLEWMMKDRDQYWHAIRYGIMVKGPIE